MWSPSRSNRISNKRVSKWSLFTLFLFPDTCKAGWEPYKVFCYKVFRTEENFKQANSSCISAEAGLVFVENFAERYFLDTILEKGEKVFVGMTDIAEEGQ